MVHRDEFVAPFASIIPALQPYSRLSPGFRSDTKILSLDLRLLFGSMTQEEYSPWVKQEFLMTCNVPTTLPSEILNSVKDSRSMSGLRAWPEHSTSSRLGNPRNSRTVRPEIKGRRARREGMYCSGGLFYWRHSQLHFATAFTNVDM